MDVKKKLALLEAKYQTANTEEERLDLLSEMILEIRTEDVDQALVLAEKLMERSKVINYKLGIGNAFNHKGACFWIKGEYEDGLDELAEAYSIAREINDATLEAKALNNYGRIYRELGDISNALVHFEEALEINEKLNNVINQSINLTNIANLYLDLSDYDSALEYALKCLPIFEREQDPTRLTNIYNTLGNVYYKKELHQEALEYFQKMQLMTDDTSPSKSLSNSGLGKVYFKLGDYEKASHYLNVALEQAKETNNFEVEIICLYYLGYLFEKQSLYSKSLQFYNEALALANEFLRKQDLVSIHERLSILYDTLNDVPKAYEHLKTYEKLKEDIFHQNTYDKMRNLQIKNKIEVAKKEKEVAERTAMLKQQFMANMSHEIRTPMNKILKRYSAKR
jgi:tetratricopeptide (TPR) repeat protein